MRIAVTTLGCPKNRSDTERFLAGLGSSVEIVALPREADVAFINTCGFIRPAVEESIQAILGAAEEIAEARPRPRLAVAGCLVARYREELAREIPEVDLWLDPAEQEAWPAALRALTRHEAGEPKRVLTPTTPPSYGYLKISEGCDHRCRFCAIPNLRGPFRSRPLSVLLEEAKSLLASGRREIVLVAQDVSAYGRDLKDKSALCTLLEEVHALPGIARLRLLYLYPRGITEELLRRMKELGPTVLPYFDIPFQHAHPDVLRRMGRPFTAPPEEVVERVRNHLPEAALRTTLIVGYPGETEAHFARLEAFVRGTRFDHLGVFTYFPEEGTPAAAFADQLPEPVKQERRARIMEAQRKISAEKLSRLVGERMEVLVDEVHPEWPGLHTGRVWLQAPEIDGTTYVSGPGTAPGALVEAEITETTEYDLVALAL